MNKKAFEILLKEIVTRCVILKDKYISIPFLPVDWICIFSQSEKEYNEFLINAKYWGHVVQETSSGPIFKFDRELSTLSGIPKVLKIRTPDPTKPERGDVDFSTDYPNFKKNYFDNQRFKLIVREKFEMIELKDEDMNVICYFSSIPPSSLVN